MTQETAAVTGTPLNLLSKFSLYSRKLASGLETIGEGVYLIYRHGLYKDPNNPVNTRYVQYFCRRLCEVFNIEVQVHGTLSHKPSILNRLLPCRGCAPSIDARKHISTRRCAVNFSKCFQA